MNVEAGSVVTEEEQRKFSVFLGFSPQSRRKIEIILVKCFYFSFKGSFIFKTFGFVY